MDYIFNAYDDQPGSSSMTLSFVMYSLNELYGVYLNSSKFLNRDGRLVENGIIFNCTKTSRSAEYLEYVLWIYLISCIFVYSMITKRTSYKKEECKGKPGLVIPMNMLNSHDYIIEYTLIFLSLSEEIFTYIFGFKSEIGSYIPIVKFLIKICLVIIFSLLSYPILAAICARHLIGYVTALIGTIVYFSLGIHTSYTWSFCLDGTKLIPRLIVIVIYTSIDLAIICTFSWKTINHIILNRCKNREIKKYNQRNYQYSILYVKELLKEQNPIKTIEKDPLEEIESGVEIITNNFKCNEMRMKVTEKVYKQIPGFSIPPRLMIGIFVGLYFAYRISLEIIFDLTPVVWNLIKNINGKYLSLNLNVQKSFNLIYANYSLFKNIEIKNAYCFLTFFYVHLLIGCIICALIIGFINSLFQSFLLLRNYRLHFHKITMKGFSSLIDIKKAPEPCNLVTGFVRFSGYQAAYTLWGIIVVTSFMLVLLYLVIGLLLLPLFYVENSLPRIWLINYGPLIVASFIFNFIQNLIVKYFFVKEQGKLMEINNRKVFMIYTHSFFFFNAMMGIFNSIKRIIVWIFAGLFCFSRIDFSCLPDYLHGFDNGFMCYIGFLYTEQYHYNPIMLCFANILSPEDKQNTNENGLLLKKLDDDEKIRFRYRNLWRLSITLINNKNLVFERKQFIKSKTISD